MRKGFTASVVPHGADGQVKRVADRFALVAAAGEIATALGITGWQAGEARDAARRCFNDWLADRGGIGASEISDAKRRIAAILQSDGASRFQRWGDKLSSDRAIVTKRVGFVKPAADSEGESQESTFFFTAEPLREILRGLDFRAVIGELINEGVIVDQNGKPNKIFHVPAAGMKQRLYQIDHTKLDTGH